MQPDVLDGFAQAVIRRYAGRLVRRGGLPPSERADLEQDLAISLLKHGSQFNPVRAQRRTFVYRVVHNKAASIARAHRRLKRGHGIEFCRLDAADVTCSNRLQRADRNELELQQLALDTVEVVSRLDNEQRQLCARLKNESAAKVARQLNIPRSTLIGRIRKLRAEFERHDMRGYMASA